MKTKFKLAALALLLSAINSQLSTGLAQGSLTPPGAPAPTMKSLAQIEPRTPISTAGTTITNPGSYYLTTNLVGLGVTISADNVTLDLNGFTIFGGGAGYGIAVSSGTNLVIRNGTVRDCIAGGTAIQASAASRSRFENLRVTKNGGYALQVSEGCVVLNSQFSSNYFSGTYAFGKRGVTVRNCTFDNNSSGGSFAVVLGPGALVDGCTFTTNGFAALSAGSGSVIKDCVVIGTTGTGLLVGDDCNLTGCVVQTNSSQGIFAGNRCAIINCAVSQNAQDGIYMGDGCGLRNCVASTNGGAGIRGGGNCLIKDCTVTLNGSGGIKVLTYCQISGCMISHNAGGYATDINTGTAVTDCMVSQNSGVGINAQNRCVVRGCHVSNNNGDGIDITADCTIVNNESNENNPSSPLVDGLYVTGDRNTIDGNVLRGNGGYGIRTSTVNNNVITRNNAKSNITGSYSVSGGNDVGPIGTAAASTSPWANIQ